MDDLETTSSSSQETPVEYAGFWLRFLVIIIDYIILGVVQMMMVAPFLTIIGVALPWDIENIDDHELFTFVASIASAAIAFNLISLLIAWLYYAFMESGPRQGTLGKMALGIKVTDSNGDQIDFGRASIRYFGKIVSNVIFMIGYVLAGITPKKQALHDIMANCLVVRG